MSQMRVVLHATDFSPASRGAFTRAVQMARANDAELLLVHVLAPVAPVVSDGYIAPSVYEDLERSSRAWGNKQLAGLVARARKAGVQARPLLLDGVAHEQIVRAARSRRADLIVIGTHGRTGLAKLFLGSVAGRVVASARCPVMTVRGS